LDLRVFRVYRVFRVRLDHRVFRVYRVLLVLPEPQVLQVRHKDLLDSLAPQALKAPQAFLVPLVN
jgi:hypothetical protein